MLSEHMDLFETMHSKLILTPHLMEMSRLTNQSVTDIKANKYDLAREFAMRHNVVVALKDARTVVSDGGLQAYINITGTNGMATGGSGDVLTGIIADFWHRAWIGLRRQSLVSACMVWQVRRPQKRDSTA